MKVIVSPYFFHWADFEEEGSKAPALPMTVPDQTKPVKIRSHIGAALLLQLAVHSYRSYQSKVELVLGVVSFSFKIPTSL